MHICALYTFVFITTTTTANNKITSFDSSKCCFFFLSKMFNFSLVTSGFLLQSLSYYMKNNNNSVPLLLLYHGKCTVPFRIETKTDSSCTFFFFFEFIQIFCKHCLNRFAGWYSKMLALHLMSEVKSDRPNHPTYNKLQ